MNPNTSLPVTLEDAAKFFDWPLCAVHGVEDTLKDCSLECWPVSKRSRFTTLLATAATNIRKATGQPLSPFQTRNERVDLGADCKVVLRHKPLLWLGERVCLSERVLSVKYAPPEEIQCLGIPDSVGSSGDDYVGYVVVADFPAGTKPEDIEFNYPDSGRLFSKQLLPKPEIHPLIEPESGIMFAAIATWPSCYLVRADIDCAKPCANGKLTQYIKTVKASVWATDQTAAVKVRARCSCGGCTHDDIEECAISAEIINAATGEICIRPVEGCGCGAARHLWINYGAGYRPDEVDNDLKVAIILRALTLHGVPEKFGCDNYIKKTEQWLEQSPLANMFNRRFNGISIGFTQADVRIAEIIGADKDDRKRREAAETSAFQLGGRPRKRGFW